MLKISYVESHWNRIYISGEKKKKKKSKEKGGIDIVDSQSSPV